MHEWDEITACVVEVGAGGINLRVKYGDAVSRVELRCQHTGIEVWTECLLWCWLSAFQKESWKIIRSTFATVNSSPQLLLLNELFNWMDSTGAETGILWAHLERNRTPLTFSTPTDFWGEQIFAFYG